MVAQADRESWRIVCCCPDEDRPHLSRQDCHIIRLLAEGKGVRAVAHELYLAPNTIKSHLHKMYLRLHVKSHPQLVAEAFRLGILVWEQKER